MIFYPHNSIAIFFFSTRTIKINVEIHNRPRPSIHSIVFYFFNAGSLACKMYKIPVIFGCHYHVCLPNSFGGKSFKLCFILLRKAFQLYVERGRIGTTTPNPFRIDNTTYLINDRISLFPFIIYTLTRYLISVKVFAVSRDFRSILQCGNNSHFCPTLISYIRVISRIPRFFDQLFGTGIHWN